jgi:hypothetical protein
MPESSWTQCNARGKGILMFGWLGIIIGILLFLIGGFLVVFFPSTEEHQGETFGLTGVILGFILLIAAFFLVFF